jgi:hypothetical protein
MALTKKNNCHSREGGNPSPTLLGAIAEMDPRLRGDGTHSWDMQNLNY